MCSYTLFVFGGSIDSSRHPNYERPDIKASTSAARRGQPLVNSPALSKPRVVDHIRWRSRATRRVTSAAGKLVASARYMCVVYMYNVIIIISMTRKPDIIIIIIIMIMIITIITIITITIVQSSGGTGQVGHTLNNCHCPLVSVTKCVCVWRLCLKTKENPGDVSRRHNINSQHKLEQQIRTQQAGKRRQIMHTHNQLLIQAPCSALLCPDSAPRLLVYYIIR